MVIDFTFFPLVGPLDMDMVQIKSFWFLTLFLTGTAAAHSSIRFDHITINEGLSQNAATWVTQDSRGFIWIGTHDGLNRYDGYEIKVYKNDPANANSLSDNAVRMILEDEDGMLWIATMDGGLNRLDPYTETIMRYVHDPNRAESLSDNILFGILEDRRGLLWVSHGAGIDCLNRDTGQITHYMSPPGVPFDDEAGNVWLMVWPHKLYFFDDTSQTLAPYALPISEKSDNWPSALYLKRSGTLLIVSRTKISTFDLQTRRMRDVTIDLPQGMLTAAAVTAIEDRSGHWLIGTLGNGLLQIHPKTGKIQRFRHDPYDPKSLSNDIVYHLFQDQSGIIWISTEGGGVNLIKEDKWKFPHTRHIPDSSESISSDYVTAIFAHPDGELFVGTGGSGLNRIDEGSGEVTIYRYDPKTPKSSLSHDYVYSIEVSDDLDQLWIGTGEGLNRFDIKTDRFEHFMYDPDDPGSISDSLVHNAFTDSKSTLWVIARRYLDKRRKGSSKFVRVRSVLEDPDGISIGPGHAIYEDRSGTIWVGSWGGGLNRYDAGRDGFDHFVHHPDDPKSISHNRVWAIYEDTKGRLWVGTYGGGLNLFERDSETFARYSEKDGLANNVIYGILEDGQGCLWMSTNKGLSKFEPQTQTFTNYDTDDGVQGNEFNTGAFCKRADGKMYFGGTNGYNAFYPADINRNPNVPPVVITSFSISGRKTLLDKPNDAPNEIALDHNENHVSFEFAALDYNAPMKNQYAFLLEPLETDWSLVGADRRFADYRNLAPGRYTFRVKGSNNDGVWNEKGTTVSFHILPPFWATWWFRTLALISFGFLFYYAINAVKKYSELIEFWRTKNIIADYKVVDKIGSGGMGVVYKGISLKDRKRTVAIKLLNEDLFAEELSRRRFLNEGAIVDAVNHPNIVDIYERGVHGNTLFIAMEYLHGVTLRRKIDDQGILPESESQSIMRQLIDVISMIHSRGIMHRDLKPENIMLVDKEGLPKVVKILDFGLAKWEEFTRMTQSGMFLGTIGYAPPEQIAHQTYDLPGDIHALGCIFYELVTGERPFFGESSLEIMKQVLQEDPIPPITFNPTLSEELNDLLLCMLDKDPNGRPTAADLKEAFDNPA